MKYTDAGGEDGSKELYKGLPAKFTIYRGQDADSPIGLSWTTDKTVAEGFARGHRFMNNHNPVVLSKTVRKSSVAFVSQSRSESEVILFRIPSRCEVIAEAVKDRVRGKLADVQD